jgi:hypothetical protein
MQWSNVVGELRRAGKLVDEAAGSCELVVERDGRRQRVVVERAQAGAAITISAPVCASRHINAHHALEYNGLSEPWALGLVDDAYVLRRTIAIAALPPDELAQAIESVAAEAARLHQLKVPAQAEAHHELGAQLFRHWSM